MNTVVSYTDSPLHQARREYARKWRAANRERVAAHNQNQRDARAKYNRKYRGEAIRAKATAYATDSFRKGRVAREIFEQYQRGKSPADIVIRMMVPMSLVNSVIASMSSGDNVCKMPPSKP